MKRILSILLCLMMVLSLFAGCNDQGDTKATNNGTKPTENHKHTFSKEWSHDESGHWYAADCGHEVKANQGEHLDENLDGDCDICGWSDAKHEHTFDNTQWKNDATHHWYAATCPHIGAVSEKAEHVDENNDGACDVCAYLGDHVHTYEDNWSSDDKQHWHAATCGHNVASAKANHVDYNQDGTCDTCGWFDQSHTHTFSDAWETDVVYHWHAATCEHIGAESEKAEHADTDGDKLCDVCAYYICDHVDYDLDGKCDLCGWFDPNHTHEYGEMGCDKSGHWLVATCHPGAVSETEEHVDTNKDGTCDTCLFQICGHSYAMEWSSDETHHWHAILCTCNVPRKDYAPHTLDETGACTECMYGYVVRSAYEVVVDNAPFTIVMDKMITFAEFKVNFPQPGRYVLSTYCVDDPENNMGLDLRIVSSSDGSGTINREEYGFSIDVTEAGEMTLYFRVFDFDYQDKQIPVVYSVVRMDDLEIDTLKGKVELPTNTTYVLKFKAPAVGEYKMITGVEGLVIGLTKDSMEFFKGHISFTVTEIGQEFTFYIELNDLTRKSFIFDWILEEPFYLPVNGEGNYAISVTPNQIDYKVTFTAPEAGYYSLKVDSKWLTFCYWSEVHNQPVRGNGDVLEISEVLTGWLEAGETFNTWIQTVYNYPDSVDVHDILTVTNIGQMVNLGQNTLTPGAEGSKYTIQSTGTAYYCLSVTNGEIGVIGAGGNVTWTDYFEVKVAHGFSYSFMIRGDAEVTLDITTTQYAIGMQEGETLATMKPAKEYTLDFSDLDSNAKIKLNCDNRRVLIYVNGEMYQPGTEIELLHSTITATFSGNAAAEVTFTTEVTNKTDEELQGDTAATLEVNQQALLLINGSVGEYATATFTATIGGTYVFTCSADTVVNVYIVSADGASAFIFSTEAVEGGTSGTYEFHLEAGQTITFAVKTSSGTDMNAYALITPKG